MGQPYEIRCPIHGFITLNDWERDIIAHPAFQRLRRIRQLAWTDMVYPAAMHTRFEHSLGVMHTATRMLNHVWEKRRPQLEELGFTENGMKRDLILVRLGALLHDVGHAPFSHAGEELFPPIGATGKLYKHEDYSVALIRLLMKDVINDHPANENVGISADDVADLIEGKPGLKQRRLFLRQLISSQLDADRADYLLRDSYHVGVEYGRYDLNRLISSLTTATDPETGGPVLVVEKGGIHAAEGLILARYMMFTQVYFHHTRVAFDRHLFLALQALLQEVTGTPKFPPPVDEKNLKEYAEWTDWKVLGLLQNGRGGEAGHALTARDHIRVVYETREVATEKQLDVVEALALELKDHGVFVAQSKSSWYKYPDNEIRVLREGGGEAKVIPLSEESMVVKGLTALNLARVYVPKENRENAKLIVKEVESRIMKGAVIQ